MRLKIFTRMIMRMISILMIPLSLYVDWKIYRKMGRRALRNCRSCLKSCCKGTLTHLVQAHRLQPVLHLRQRAHLIVKVLVPTTNAIPLKWILGRQIWRVALASTQTFRISVSGFVHSLCVVNGLSFLFVPRMPGDN